MKTILAYAGAALAEIAGCFALWAWLRLLRGSPQLQEALAVTPEGTMLDAQPVMPPVNAPLGLVAGGTPEQPLLFLAGFASRDLLPGRPSQRVALLRRFAHPAAE